MATITKRDGKWRVQVRRLGYPAISRTFTLRKDAELWGRQKELDLERGDLPVDSRAKLKGVKLSHLVVRYIDTVTIRKKSKDREQYILNAFLRHPLASKAVVSITTEDWARWRDERLQEVQPVSVKRYLTTFHHIYEIAREEWGMPIKENPLDKVTLNFVRNRRDRRLQDGELELIINETKKRKNLIVLPVILWAIETGMRRGEILSMRWKDIDLRNRVVLIPDTKNGTARKIPLTDQAKAILEDLDSADDRVFPIAVENFKISWRRILDKTNIQGLTFHDLRHEAVSSLFERGLNTPEVASISGHKDWRMLAIYTNPKPANILKKLNEPAYAT